MFTKKIRGTTETSEYLAASIFLQYQTHLGKLAISWEMHIRCLKKFTFLNIVEQHFSSYFFSILHS